LTSALERLLAAKEIAICCGSGGVGKTTTAAALGTMAASRLGGKVLVLTVDPARRLATALGLERFGNTETRVAPDLLASAHVEGKGELWVAMLDTKQSWDDLIRRHAPDAKTRDAILANSLYANLTSRFVQSHDYIAMERLHEIHSSGRYDLVIVDTPPSRNALDLLDAPARMAEFFGSKLLRWLTVPYRSRVMTFAAKPFTQVADRILGSQFLGDIAEFFTLLQTMEKGFVKRAGEVDRLLADRRTTFLVVSTLEAAPVRESEFFIRALAERHLPLGALILNKVLPAWLVDRAAEAAADKVVARADVLAKGPLASLGDPATTARVLQEAAMALDNLALVAKREAELRAELRTAADLVVSVPHLPGDVHDLAAVAHLGELLWA
jgi:anion-transporting  ArsA/GET3 family ATPase